MIAFLKSLFCKHRNLEFHRNIYGDEISQCGGKRSMWFCRDCKKMVLRSGLFNYPTGVWGVKG